MLKLIKDKLDNEIDCVEILHSIRELKSHLRLTYTENQLSFLRFHKNYFIRSEHPFTDEFFENRIQKLLDDNHLGDEKFKVDSKNMKIHEFADNFYRNFTSMDQRIVSSVIPQSERKEDESNYHYQNTLHWKSIVSELELHQDDNAR